MTSSRVSLVGIAFEVQVGFLGPPALNAEALGAGACLLPSLLAMHVELRMACSDTGQKTAFELPLLPGTSSGLPVIRTNGR